MPIRLVSFLNFTVNYLLLLAAAGLCGHLPGLMRTALAAAIGGAYAGLCLLPGFAFFGSALWRLVSLGIMGMITFGIGADKLRCWAVFGLLSLALDGILSGTDGKGMLLCACGICLLCLLLRGKWNGGLVPVELSYDDRNVKLTALRDTGNLLRDPVSGSPVLVIGAEAACRLTGLTQQQLQTPLETIGTIPGLRLIPYKTIGNGGMLLALRIPKVRIGSWQGSRVVAFAPEGLGGSYQALTGGTL